MKTSKKQKKQTSPKPPQPGFNEAESPLFRLFSRPANKDHKILNQQQFIAGEKLRRDYEAAHFERRVTSSWEQAVDRGSYQNISDNHIADLMDRTIDARKRVHSAFDAVGPELAGILYYVCCLAAGLEQAESRLNFPQRSGKAILGLALTRLARHYRLVKSCPDANLAPSISHWALADSRPSIMPQEKSAPPS